MRISILILLIFIPCHGAQASGQKLSADDLDIVDQLVRKVAAQSNEMKIPAADYSESIKNIVNTIYNPPEPAKDSYPRESANSCSNIDMSKEFGENEDQDSLGTCFVYSAASLLSQKIGEKVSSLDMSLSYYRQDKDSQNKRFVSDWRAGYSDTAIAIAIINGGLCAEKDLPSDDYIQSQLANPVSAEETLKIFKDLDAWQAQDSKTCGMAKELQELFPNIDLVTILAILNQDLQAKNILHWLNNIGCVHKVRIPESLRLNKEEVTSYGVGKNLISSIDRNLERGQALLMTYNLSPLLKEEFQNHSADPPTHASLIVGRSFIDGKCQYLVRNSWGSSCSYYAAAQHCHSGNFYISEQQLNDYMRNIIYFK